MFDINVTVLLGENMTAPKWYDFTLSVNKLTERGINGYEKLGLLFESLGAERYVLGRETGEGGYEHYQCRVVFKTEKDMSHLINIFAGLGDVSPTHVRDFKYCEKEGNFYRSWEKVLRKFVDLKLFDWQQSAVDELKKQNDREIMVIVDPEGNNGKSWLTKHLVANHICNIVPVLGDYKDMMRICMAKAGTGYIIDMERTQDPKKAHGLWRAIESVKNGYLFEDRYNFRDMWIEPPKILVLTNDMPPLDALSRDRWRIYTIYDQYGVQWLEEIANE
nr:MAG: replication associated protein [Smacoviridae sp.]